MGPVMSRHHAGLRCNVSFPARMRLPTQDTKRDDPCANIFDMLAGVLGLDGEVESRCGNKPGEGMRDRSLGDGGYSEQQENIMYPVICAEA
jgi:hypothetical protein